MAPDRHDCLLPCPDRLARGPRICNGGKAPHDRLYLAPPALQGAMLALVSRDTSRLLLNDAQRLSHFPASPIVTLSWFDGPGMGLVDPDTGWYPFAAQMMISGSHSRPVTTWSPTGGRGYMACFQPDAVSTLFGIELAAIQDRFLPAHAVLGAGWQPFFDALLAAPDDATVLRVLEAELGKRWRAAQGSETSRFSLRQMGRH